MPHEHSVLVVEDDTRTRKALRELLADSGLDAWASRDGRQALRELRDRGRPRIILLDLMMPRLNGWEFLEFHRSHPLFSAVPVILITGWVETDLAQAKAMIPKPIDTSLLRRRLRRLLHDEEKKARAARSSGQRSPRARARASGE